MNAGVEFAGHAGMVTAGRRFEGAKPGRRLGKASVWHSDGPFATRKGIVDITQAVQYKRS